MPLEHSSQLVLSTEAGIHYCQRDYVFITSSLLLPSVKTYPPPWDRGWVRQWTHRDAQSIVSTLQELITRKDRALQENMVTTRVQSIFSCLFLVFFIIITNYLKLGMFYKENRFM
jgi:hypothetical protein